jgi:hypothetical protein
MDLHVLCSNDRPLHDGLDNLPLLFKGKVAPSAVEAPRFREHFNSDPNFSHCVL